MSHSVESRTHLPAHLREPVCHSLARNNGCCNIFRGYCCQTWKLAHNYRLSSIAFPHLMTKCRCHSSLSSTTAPNCNLPALPEVKPPFSSPTVRDSNHPFFMRRSAAFLYLLCFFLLWSFKWNKQNSCVSAHKLCRALARHNNQATYWLLHLQLTRERLNYMLQKRILKNKNLSVITFNGGM